MTEPKVTLRIIAERCGISKFAVSRALSGKSGVSADTRKRVLTVASELGYQRPGSRARRIVVALFEDELQANGELHLQIQAGLQDEAAQLGFDLQSHWLHDGTNIEHLLESCVAIVMVGSLRAGWLDSVRLMGKPVIVSGWLDPLEPIDVVNATDHESGLAAGKHLLDLGHREIVYVHGRTDLRGRTKRLFGLREALEDVGSARLHDLTWPASGTMADALDPLLASGIRPTAYFCAHDGLALTVVTEMLSRGVAIPRDVSIVGFGDFSIARQIRPPLTTIRIPGREIGRACLRILNRRLSEGTGPGSVIRHMIVGELIVRETTGPAPEAARTDWPGLRAGGGAGNTSPRLRRPRSAR